MSSKPNPALGCAIFVIGALLLGLISFPAVGGIVIGGGAMLGVIWIIFQVIDKGGI